MSKQRERCTKPSCHRPKAPGSVLFCEPCFEREERLCIMLESEQAEREWRERKNP